MSQTSKISTFFFFLVSYSSEKKFWLAIKKKKEILNKSIKPEYPQAQDKKDIKKKNVSKKELANWRVTEGRDNPELITCLNYSMS